MSARRSAVACLILLSALLTVWSTPALADQPQGNPKGRGADHAAAQEAHKQADQRRPPADRQQPRRSSERDSHVAPGAPDGEPQVVPGGPAAPPAAVPARVQRDDAVRQPGAPAAPEPNRQAAPVQQRQAQPAVAANPRDAGEHQAAPAVPPPIPTIRTPARAAQAPALSRPAPGEAAMTPPAPTAEPQVIEVAQDPNARSSRTPVPTPSPTPPSRPTPAPTVAPVTARDTVNGVLGASFEPILAGGRVGLIGAAVSAFGAFALHLVRQRRPPS